MKKLNLLVPIAIILLCACSISNNDSEKTTGHLTVEDGRVCEYQIAIPQNWTGKYKIREEGNIALFDFNSNPKNTLFSISALTEAQWQEVQQEPGHGNEILTRDGIVFVYNVALDNPYSGDQAEIFQEMAGQIKAILGSLTMTILSTPVEMELARKTLMAFFDQLSAGNYVQAAELYGGTYENLIEMNPDIDQNEHAALLKQACTINGFMCLKLKDIVQAEQTLPDLFTFTVEFSNLDGSLFELSDCCGTSGLDKSPQYRFEYRVGRVAQLGNIFLVQTLPVYVP